MDENLAAKLKRPELWMGLVGEEVTELTVCPVCGAAVWDALKHADWHGKELGK